MCSVVQVKLATRMGKIGRIFLCVNKTHLMRNFSTKQSYYHRTSDLPLRPVTLGQLAEIASHKYGDRPALISCHQKKQITFRDALEEADRLAAGFTNLGLQRGDKIGLWAPNLIEWYLAYVACARGGFVAVLMNPFYQHLEVETMIKKVGIKSLICGDVFRKQNYYNILNEVCPEIAHCKPGKKISSQKVPSLQHVVMITDDRKKGTFKYSDILDLADEDTIKMVKQSQHKINIDDPCNIQFTSGTTGNPKAPVQSHFNIVNCGYFCGLSAGLHKKYQKILLQNPFFHVFGTIVAISSSINHGNTIVLPSDGYDPEKNLTAIVEEQCTVIFGTPTMYVDLVEMQKKRNENIKVEIALSGGALCPPKLFSDLLDVIKVKKVMSVYGLTEVTAAVFFSTENDSKYQQLNTVGKLQDHIEAKVVDKDGCIVPFGVPGELHVRGFSRMLGYHKDEAKTNEVIDPNGWVHTGDQFILTEDGYGQVVGRLKDVIIRGGENIYPKEIEEHLLTHPDILRAYVVGLPHERLGEEVCACIKTKEGIQLTVEEISRYCKDKIFKFGIPTIVEIMDSFPTTASGKIQKHKIVENLIRN